MSEEIEVKRGPGRPPKVQEEAAPSISMADMMAFFAKMSEDNKSGLIAAIQELKKPDPIEQAAKDAELKRAAERRAMGIEAAKREESNRLARQQNCSHTRPDGKHTFRAQVNTDGCYRPSCSYCGWVSKPIKATDYQKAEGVGMHDWPNSSANIENFNRLAATTIPDAIPEVPAGFQAAV